MLIYLDGLSEKKKARLTAYLQKRMSSLVEYYVSLLKRKEIEQLALPQLMTDLEHKKNKTVKSTKIIPELN